MATDTRVENLKAALEGELNGLAISDEQAARILSFLDSEEPFVWVLPDDTAIFTMGTVDMDKMRLALLHLEGAGFTVSKCKHIVLVENEQP